MVMNKEFKFMTKLSAEFGECLKSWSHSRCVCEVEFSAFGWMHIL